MTDLSENVNGAIKTLSGEWTKYAALGSFALYAAGYLALRFHLSVLGLATDLSVLDERYVFAGARFVLYLMAALPNILIMVFPFALLGWFLSRAVPSAARSRIVAGTVRPWPILLFGGVVALGAIQTLMRQCFLLHDLLLAPALPKHWLVTLLLCPQNLPYYFDALVALCLVSLACLKLLYGIEQLSGALVAGRSILAVLCVIQFLLLPINFGSLIIDKTLSRVTPATALLTKPGQTAWLVWEGKTGITFLVCNADAQPCSLITRPADKGLTIEVIGADPIFSTLFSDTRARKAPTLTTQP